MALSADAARALLEPRLSSLTMHHARLDAYYEGAQRIAAMGLALPPEMRQLETIVNWPATVVGAIGERQAVEGFRLAGDRAVSDRMGELWRYNQLDQESYPAHIETLVHGRSWLTVDYNETDSTMPVIIPESAAAMAVDRNPRTREITAALRRWEEYAPDGSVVDLSTVYLPDSTTYYVNNAGRWEEYDRIDHELGVVPVVPMLNRPRLSSRHRPLAWWGASEMTDVIPLTDAACRALTNLQGAQELLAVPTRYVFGAQQSDFVDASTGQPLTTWEAYLGRMNALGDPSAKVEQLPAADLNNFTAVLNGYAKLISSVTGIPLRYFGVSSDANPASAEAIQSDETRLVMRCQRQNRNAGSAWSQAMRIAMALAGDDAVDASTQVETVWASPETPTFAAKAAALAQVWQAGLPIPRSFVYDTLGFTQQQRDEAEDQASSDVLNQLLTGGTTGGAALEPGNVRGGESTTRSATRRGLPGATASTGTEGE